MTKTQAAPTTAAELIAYKRAHRGEFGEPPPAGNILDAATLADNLTVVLEQHVELLRERWPTQPMKFNLDHGRELPSGPRPPPFDPSQDPTASALALLIGFVQDAR